MLDIGHVWVGWWRRNMRKGKVVTKHYLIHTNDEPSGILPLVLLVFNENLQASNPIHNPPPIHIFMIFEPVIDANVDMVIAIAIGCCSYMHTQISVRRSLPCLAQWALEGSKKIDAILPTTTRDCLCEHLGCLFKNIFAMLWHSFVLCDLFLPPNDGKPSSLKMSYFLISHSDLPTFKTLRCSKYLSKWASSSSVSTMLWFLIWWINKTTILFSFGKEFFSKEHRNIMWVTCHDIPGCNVEEWHASNAMPK